MNTKVERIAVEKMVVSVNGTTLELSIEDARKLHDELCDALGLCKPVNYPVVIQQQPYQQFTPNPFVPHWHPPYYTYGGGTQFLGSTALACRLDGQLTN